MTIARGLPVVLMMFMLTSRTTAFGVRGPVTVWSASSGVKLFWTSVRKDVIGSVADRRRFPRLTVGYQLPYLCRPKNCE
jgi:hypothetical protein